MKLILKSLFNNFWRLHKKLLKKNRVLKDKYKGKECVIFGNGGSIKYLDIKKHTGYFYMGTTYALLHKEIRKLKLDFYVIPQKYDFYPIIYDGRENHFSFNRRLKIYKEIFNKSLNTRYFINLSNYYGFFKKPSKINYFFSFNEYNSELNNFDFNLNNNFNCTTNSLEIMIGIAKYLGFKKLVLIGCDYLGEPKIDSHFYSDEDPWYGAPIDSNYSERVKKLTDDIEIVVIFPNGISSKKFQSYTYEEYFNNKLNENKTIQIKKNYDIIEKSDIELLRKAAEYSQLDMMARN